MSLKPVLFIYNLIATIWSLITAYIFFGSLWSVWFQRDLFMLGMKLFWLMKIFELMDTFFMLMRRKYEQLSLLHIYHHSSMVLLTEWFYKFYPLTQIAFPSFLNSFVHVIMYTYYALNSINIPCPWKKYLTLLQLGHFAILIVHGVVGGIAFGDWPFSLYVVYELSMLFCFYNFYRKTYNKDKLQPKFPTEDQNKKLQSNGVDQKID